MVERRYTYAASPSAQRIGWYSPLPLVVLALRWRHSRIVSLVRDDMGGSQPERR